MSRDTPPAHWVRLQTLTDASGWPAVLALAGRPAFPAELAEREAERLRALHHVRVLRDGTGRPCVDPADPGVQDWARELDARVAETAEAIERQLEASRGG